MSIGVDGRWEAGIGDPTVVGWITVVAYGVSAALSLRCARRTAIGLEHWFWVGAAVALVLLGFNKQLDLQTLVTQIGRDMAMREGWYAERRVAQAAFVSALPWPGWSLWCGCYGWCVACLAPLRPRASAWYCSSCSS